MKNHALIWGVAFLGCVFGISTVPALSSEMITFDGPWCVEAEPDENNDCPDPVVSFDISMPEGRWVEKVTLQAHDRFGDVHSAALDLWVDGTRTGGRQSVPSDLGDVVFEANTYGHTLRIEAAVDDDAFIQHVTVQLREPVTYHVRREWCLAPGSEASDDCPSPAAAVEVPLGFDQWIGRVTLSATGDPDTIYSGRISLVVDGDPVGDALTVPENGGELEFTPDIAINVLRIEPVVDEKVWIRDIEIQAY